MQLTGNSLQHVTLGRGIEVDQHVADEDHVEVPQRGKRLQQVLLAEGDGIAQCRHDLKAVRHLREVLHELLHGEAALDLELVVDPLLRACQRRRRVVGRHDLHLRPAQRGAHLVDDHGDGVGLLSRGTGRTPDADRTPLGPHAREQFGNELLLERQERGVVSEEERLPGRHRVADRLRHLRGRSRAQRLEQRRQVGEVEP